MVQRWVAAQKGQDSTFDWIQNGEHVIIGPACLMKGKESKSMLAEEVLSKKTIEEVRLSILDAG